MHSFILLLVGATLVLSTAVPAQETVFFRMQSTDVFISVKPKTNAVMVIVGVGERSIADFNLWLLQTNGLALEPTHRFPSPGKKPPGAGKLNSVVYSHSYTFEDTATNGAALVLKLNEEFKVFPLKEGKLVAAQTPVNQAEAITIAKEYLEGKNVNVQGLKAKTSFRAGLWIVTFPKELPAGTRGGSFEAQVWVDRYSGEVRELVVED